MTTPRAARTGLLLLLAMVLLTPPRAVAQDQFKDLTFAVAIAQGVRSYSSPGLGSHFRLEILQPYQVLDYQTVAGIEYAQLRDPSNGKPGWVDKRLLETWNSRYALKAKKGASTKMLGYCTQDAIQAAVSAGQAAPCASFTAANLRNMTNTRAPFPVLRVQNMFDEDNLQTLVMELLVPTLYSNIVGIQKAKTDPGGVLEIIILIDATGSMQAEIAGVTQALTKVVTDAENLGKAGRTVKFLVLAYRDIEGAASDAKCKVLDSSSGPDRLAFGTAQQARTFLGGLTPECGGEKQPEALWDAIYALKSLKVTPGADRALLIVGDAPSHPTTQGGTFVGVTVPAGLTADEVYATVAKTLGQSTLLIPTIVETERSKAEGSIEKSIDQLFGAMQFNQPSISKITIDKTSQNAQQSFDEMATKLSARLQTALSEHSLNSERIDKCRQTFAEGFGNSAIAIFCMESSSGVDEALAARIRDLLGREDEDLVVVRRIWVKWDQTVIGDVVLLDRNEATSLKGALDKFSSLTKSGDCSTQGASVWTRIMKTLVPMEEESGNMPALGTKLVNHLGVSMNVAKGKSTIVHKSPAEMRSLSVSQCKELSEDLRNSAQGLSKLLDNDADSAHIWIPLSVLP